MKDTLSLTQPNSISKSTNLLFEYMRKEEVNQTLMAILIGTTINAGVPQKYRHMKKIYLDSQKEDLAKDEASKYLDLFAYKDRNANRKLEYVEWKTKILSEPTKARSLLANLALQRIMQIYYNKVVDLITWDDDVIWGLRGVTVNSTVAVTNRKGESIPVHMKQSGFHQ